MRDEILKVVMSHIESAETAFKITDELCILFGVGKSNPLMDDMENCIILLKPNYLHKNGKILSACYKTVGDQKIYFTHKDNLYSH